MDNNNARISLSCADISKYENIIKIGQGTFGEVFKAINIRDKQIVAIKKVFTKNETEGFPITALREIKILQRMNHVNIVNLIEVCTSCDSSGSKRKMKFYLVFEFCEHDLAGLLSNPIVKFSLGENKMIMKQLLHGLFFLHANHIIHRDMKASNILITKNGILKVADFGLARPISSAKDRPHRYTNRVVTLWYRPPELLLGERNYGPPIDMWGAGCIMAELWTRRPIMQGATEQHQLDLISHLCGSIDRESFPGVEELELFTQMEVKKGQKRIIKDRLQPAIKDNFALDLLDKLLIISPVKRIDSDSALSHDFFYTEPAPEVLRLENYVQSNFEFYSNRNPLQVRNAVPRPVARQPKVMEEYHDRVF